MALIPSTNTIFTLFFLFAITAAAVQAQKNKEGQPKRNGRTSNVTFYMQKDWPLQKFNVTEVVTFTINAPQMSNRKNRQFNLRIALFGTKVPYTVGNFAQLAAGGIEVVNNSTTNGADKKEKSKILHYKNTILHRLEKGVSIQGGDVVYNNGSGSVTRYNAEAMAAENYWLSNYGKGWVGMVHNGPPYYSIGCQFYICMTNNRTILSALNLQRFVVIGKVTSGMNELDALNDAIDNDVQLDKTLVPQTGYPLNKPTEDIKIVKASYMQIKKLGRVKQSNRPSVGSLYGEWPQPPQSTNAEATN